MMQQLATQRSDLAALPVDVEGTQTADAQGEGHTFSLMLDAETAAHQQHQSSAKSPDNSAQAEQTKVTAKTQSCDAESKTLVADNKQITADVVEDAEKMVKGEPVAPPPAAEDQPDDGDDGSGRLVNMPVIEDEPLPDDTLRPVKGSVDWLALVDAVRRYQQGDSNQDKSDTQIDGEGDLVIDETNLSEQLPEDIVALLKDAQKAIDNKDDAFFDFGDKAPDEKILPVLPIMEKLITLLQGDKASTESAVDNSDVIAADSDNANSDILALLSGSDDATASEQALALAQALLAGVEKPAASHSDDSQTNDGELTEQLLTQLITGDSEQAPTVSEDNGEQTADDSRVVDDAAADAAILLSLLKTELNAAKADTTPTAEADIKVTDTTVSDTTADVSAVATDPAVPLLQALNTLSSEGQEKATQALADKVVAALPETATPGQQQQVKDAVIAGVKEMQSQLAQGHEPAISVKDLVAQAMSDAGLDTSNQTMQRVDQQVAQLSQVLSVAQQTLHHAINSAAQHAMAAQLASTDNAIQENTQMRSESTTAQQHQDGLDKGINFHKPEGQQQLAEKVRWMVNSRNTMADIRLDPPELGSMQVRVNVSGDTASVNFIVQSPQARDALADAVPRLRDMLAEQGITLGESFVQQQDSGQGEGTGDDSSQFAGNGQGTGEDENDAMTVVEQRVSRNTLGGIDAYA